MALGAGPGEGERLVVDIDSTIDEVHGKKKHGAAYGYTKKLGYHPILATWAKTGEILHARLRKGSANTQRGIKRFVEELVPLRAGPARADRSSCALILGFWSNETIATLGRLGVNYTMAVRTGTKTLAKAIAAIAEDAWVEINYPEGRYVRFI